MSRVRVLAHVDLDAFYTQVEIRRNKDIVGKPVVVVQYNPYGDLQALGPEERRIFPDSNGSIIAVSYEARKHGVKRNMSGQQAKKLCPDLQIVQVPTAHGKADLTIYREAGAQVVAILSTRAACERASIDEAYLDLTDEVSRRRREQEPEGDRMCQPPSFTGCHVCGMPEGAPGAEAWWARSEGEWAEEERMLALGAVVVAELRAEVLRQLGFTCSAGIAHYKVLAKLASGLHKPAQQTLVPAAAVPALLKPLPIPKMRQLGGKFGESLMKNFNIATMGELAALPASRLETMYDEETTSWLMQLARGVDSGEVKVRMVPKSLSCGKTFRGTHALQDLSHVHHWLHHLGQELEERLEADRKENQRTARLLTVAVEQTPLVHGPGAPPGKSQTVSRSCPLRRSTAEVLAEDGTALVRKWVADKPGWRITSMFMTASNFVDAGSCSITHFFKQAPGRTLASVEAQDGVHDGEGVDTPSKGQKRSLAHDLTTDVRPYLSSMVPTTSNNHMSERSLPAAASPASSAGTSSGATNKRSRMDSGDSVIARFLRKRCGDDSATPPGDVKEVELGPDALPVDDSATVRRQSHDVVDGPSSGSNAGTNVPPGTSQGTQHRGPLVSGDPLELQYHRPPADVGGVEGLSGKQEDMDKAYKIYARSDLQPDPAASGFFPMESPVCIDGSFPPECELMSLNAWLPRDDKQDGEAGACAMEPTVGPQEPGDMPDQDDTCWEVSMGTPALQEPMMGLIDRKGGSQGRTAEDGVFSGGCPPGVPPGPAHGREGHLQSLRKEEVDWSVMEALPEDIQKELLQALESPNQHGLSVGGSGLSGPERRAKLRAPRLKSPQKTNQRIDMFFKSTTEQ